MKKAKEPGDFLNKAADLLSIFKNFTGNKKENTGETVKPFDNIKKDSCKNPTEQPVYNPPSGIPSLPPHEYGTNVFRIVIEKHDKAVKNIMKKHPKKDE